MLVIAELHAGNDTAVLRSLATAGKMLLARTTTECLQQSLNARVEMALMFSAFIRLCRGLDGHMPARRLVTALSSDVTGGLGSPHSP